MSDAVIFAISLGVTLLGLVISWGVYRRRGAAPGLRGASWSLVPVAATMTGATGFFMDLAFSPAKWAGVSVAGLAVLLYLTSGAMLSRRAGAGGGEVTGGKDRKERKEKAPKAPKAAGGDSRKAVERRQATPVDPDLAEIEEILRNRGIK